MSFTVNKSDGSVASIVADGTTINPGVDLSIAIIGRNINDYAENIAQNHLHIMENFADDTSPLAPTRGQLWFNTNDDRLYVRNSFAAWERVVQVVRDPTPQLGGNLDSNGNSITTGGHVVLSFASGTEEGANWVDVVWSESGQGPILRSIGSDTDVDLRLQAKGTGRLELSDLLWPSSDGISGQVLTTDGSGDLAFTTVAAGGLVDVVSDLTPQLGGDLDVNGNAIVSVSGGDIPITPDGSGQVILDGLSWPGEDGGAGDVLVTNGAGSLSFTANLAATALQNVVEDLTPQLGGNLDFNSFAITNGATEEVLKFAGSPGAVNQVTLANAVTLTPPTISATGDDPDVDLKLRSKGTGDIILCGSAGPAVMTAQDAAVASGLSGGQLTVKGGDGDGGGDGGDLILNPGAAGESGADGSVIIGLDPLTWPVTDGTVGQSLTTDGAGNLSFTTIGGLNDIVDDTTPQLGGSLDVNGNSIVSVSGGNIPITPDGAGQVVLDGLSWPISDGSNGDFLTTDGFGALSFVTPAASINNVVEDLTPQLGGNLDANSFEIEEDGNVILSFTSGGENAVNWVDLRHAVTGVGPTIAAVGSDTNVDLNLTSKGTGAINLNGVDASTLIANVVEDTTPQLGGNLNVTGFSLVHSGEVVVSFASGGETGVNNVELVNAATGSGPIIRSVGSDTNVDLNLTTQGTGAINLNGVDASTLIANVIEDLTPTLGGTLDVNGNQLTGVGNIAGSNDNNVLELIDLASAVNNVKMTNNITGSGPTIEANGSDTNVRLNITGKGTGTTRIQSSFDIASSSSFVTLSTIGDDGGDGKNLLLLGSSALTDNGGSIFIVPGDGAGGTGDRGGDLFLRGGSGTLNGLNGTVCIQDANTNDVACFLGVPFSVNWVDVTNSATGSGPIIASVGADTNVDLNLEAKGTGEIVAANPIVLPAFTVAGAPTATAGAIAYFSNGAAGSPILAFGNGTDWLRSDTGTAISSS